MMEEISESINQTSWTLPRLLFYNSSNEPSFYEFHYTNREWLSMYWLTEQLSTSTSSIVLNGKRFTLKRHNFNFHEIIIIPIREISVRRNYHRKWLARWSVVLPKQIYVQRRPVTVSTALVCRCVRCPEDDVYASNSVTFEIHGLKMGNNCLVYDDKFVGDFRMAVSAMRIFMVGHPFWSGTHLAGPLRSPSFKLLWDH